MQRYFSKELNNNKFLLGEDDIYHITRVMRMKTGDKIEVIYQNELYICEVSVNENIEITLKEKMEVSEKREPGVTLIIPLLKEQKMDLILQKSTELGVSEIVPVVMERSIIKLDSSKEEKRIERWTRICKEAAEQSKRLNIPIITKVKSLKELEKMEGLKVVCSTTEKNFNLKKLLSGKQKYDRINIVVGPEGGISPKEEELLVGLGFKRVSLGNRIMRVETVPIYILSVLNYEFME